MVLFGGWLCIVRGRLLVFCGLLVWWPWWLWFVLLIIVYRLACWYLFDLGAAVVVFLLLDLVGFVLCCFLAAMVMMIVVGGVWLAVVLVWCLCGICCGGLVGGLVVCGAICIVGCVPVLVWFGCCSGLVFEFVKLVIIVNSVVIYYV